MKTVDLKNVGFYYSTYSNCGQEDIGYYVSNEEFFLRPSRLLKVLDFENVETNTPVREVLEEILKSMFGLEEEGE